jgi:hypothetical protein
MRKFWQRAVVAGLAVLGATMPTSAQTRSDTEQENNIPYGTRAGEFLLLPVGGRATALGSAFTALADDISALYWNPAGVALAGDRQAMVSYIDYMADTRHVWVGFATPFGAGDKAIGFQVGSFGFSDQAEYTVDQPEGTGRTYSVDMSVIGLTYSQQFSDRFSFGATGKYISENLAGANASTFAVDIGTTYHSELGGRPIRGAFTITNLGGELKHTGTTLQTDLPELDPSLPPGSKEVEFSTKAWELPTAFRVGVAYDVISSANSRLTAAGEFAQPTGNDVAGALGAEYALMDIGDTGFSAALRGGYAYESDNGLDVGGSRMNGTQGDGLSFGGGIGYMLTEQAGFNVDYAFRDKGLLGDQHLFSLGVRF